MRNLRVLSITCGFELTDLVQVGNGHRPLVVGEGVGVEVEVITEVGVKEVEALPGELLLFGGRDRTRPP